MIIRTEQFKSAKPFYVLEQRNLLSSNKTILALLISLIGPHIVAITLSVLAWKITENVNVVMCYLIVWLSILLQSNTNVSVGISWLEFRLSRHVCF